MMEGLETHPCHFHWCLAASSLLAAPDAPARSEGSCDLQQRVGVRLEFLWLGCVERGRARRWVLTTSMH